MEQKIITPSGNTYMVAAYEKDTLMFKEFGPNKVTVVFDAKVLDQLIPFLNEVNFWRKTNETSN